MHCKKHSIFNNRAGFLKSKYIKNMPKDLKGLNTIPLAVAPKYNIWERSKSYSVGESCSITTLRNKYVGDQDCKDKEDPVPFKDLPVIEQGNQGLNQIYYSNANNLNGDPLVNVDNVPTMTVPETTLTGESTGGTMCCCTIL